MVCTAIWLGSFDGWAPPELSPATLWGPCMIQTDFTEIHTECGVYMNLS